MVMGELEDFPNVDFDAFSIFFHSKPMLLPDLFGEYPVLQLDVSAEVPWLSNIPEEM
jgi:hypothetical protein